MLKVSHLTVGYGKKPLIEDCNFELQSGLTVLLGQNGSGKTTLFRALSGALPLMSGQVFLDGTDVLSLSVRERARRIARVFGFHQNLTGITGEALALQSFYPRMGFLSHPGQAERDAVRQLARRMNAESLLDRFLETMSTGERQTVALLAALCQDTPLLLLDEPTAALDFNRTHDFFSKVKSSAKSKILFVTLHDPGLALSYADRILLMQNGKIAGNFLPGRTSLRETEDALRLLFPGIRVTAAEGMPAVLFQTPSDATETR